MGLDPGQIIKKVYDPVLQALRVTSVGGGGGGAPADATYITATPNATLTNELVLGAEVIMKDVIASRPAAALNGRVFWSSDEGILYRDTGAVWDKIAVRDYADLEGIPATFPPAAHAASHEAGGSDPIGGPLDLEELSPAAPAANILRLYAEDQTNRTVMRLRESTGLTFQFPGQEFFLVRNETGSTLTKGTAVYFNLNAVAGAPRVGRAQGNSTGQMPCVGIAAEGILHNAEGYVQILGVMTGIDTTGGVAGDVIYVSASVAGALDFNTPSFPAINQIVGIVLVGGSVNGTIFVSIGSDRRMSDGTRDNTFRIGNQDGLFTSRKLQFHRGAALIGSLEWLPTGNRVLDLPDVTDTLLGIAQAITIAANARVATRKNSGAVVGTRRRLNFIEGANVAITLADDGVSEEVDVTIAFGGSPKTTEVDLGATPIFRGSFLITDADITVNSEVLAWQAPGPYSGKGTRADEAELQPVKVTAVEPLSGQARVYWETPPIIGAIPYAVAGGDSGAANSDLRTTGTLAPYDAVRFARAGKVQKNVVFTYMVL